MRSTANVQKPETKLGGAGRTTSVGLDLVTNSMGAVLVIKNKRGILTGLAEGSARDQATMSLLELEPVIFGGTEGIITFMRSHGLLAHSINCIRGVNFKYRRHGFILVYMYDTRCGMLMVERSRNDVTDGEELPQAGITHYSQLHDMTALY